MNIEVIKVNVISDVACPWCYVGKRRFEEALRQWKGAPVAVTWHPYQLDPSMREEGMNRDTYLRKKFGSADGVQEMTDRLTEVGKTVGIDFDFGDNWLAVNTLQMHQLLNVAREEGFGAELKERLLSAYFQEAKHLNNVEELYKITKEFGWNPDKVDSIINNSKIAESVQNEISNYQQRGVSGVPFFVINDQYGISGAQPAEVFLEAFESLSQMESSEEGNSCTPNSGCC
ncbi:MAG: DsbA family oxidoreductase [Crocinitomicaceae bacterium]|nr:DsbA family oxidoreductase [Crocinitomicaceae bacterium]